MAIKQSSRPSIVLRLLGLTGTEGAAEHALFLVLFGAGFLVLLYRLPFLAFFLLLGVVVRAGALLYIAFTRIFRELQLSRADRSLLEAADVGDVEHVKELLGAGANIHSRWPETGWTALHLGARGGHRDIVELLLNHSADVNAPANDGATPLHVAAMFGQVAVAETLLGNGANVNVKAKKGDVTPLHIASGSVESDMEEIQRMMPRVERTEAESVTTLLSRADTGRQRIMELLLANGADVNARDDIGGTPLHRAIWDKSVAALLIANGAEVNARSEVGATPLHLAVYDGRTEVCKLLLANGADVDSRLVSGGWTPLMGAAEMNHADIIRLLIANGADVNARANDGGIILHYIARVGAKEETARLLIASGADVNARNNIGQTPLDVARAHDRSSIGTTTTDKPQDIPGNVAATCPKCGHTWIGHWHASLKTRQCPQCREIWRVA
jgi:ankyrin repeat protein